MSAPKSKADGLDDLFDEISVEEWDARLLRIGRSWMRAYANRQIRAKEEGVTTPPPTPPWIDDDIARATGAPFAKENSRQPATELLDLNGLIAIYTSKDDSPYNQVQYSTQKYYKTLCRQLGARCGGIKLSELDETSIRGLYNDWTDGGTNKIALGISLIGMLRGLCTFGAKTLEDRDCERLIGVMSRMEFDRPAARQERLTKEQVNLIRVGARQIGKPSIALAQAFQFELGLKQKDVIGEWVPLSEDGISGITRDGYKWIRGLRWEEIDDSWVLRRTDDGEELVFDLKSSPMVMEELSVIPRLRSGPMILNEHNDLPWIANEFRRWWRKIANKAGLPRNLRNTDAGGDKADAKRKWATGETL